MKELGEAINESLSDSESIAEVVARIKEGGYDIFLVLEATIGVSKQGEHTTDKTSLVSHAAQHQCRTQDQRSGSEVSEVAAHQDWTKKRKSSSSLSRGLSLSFLDWAVCALHCRASLGWTAVRRPQRSGKIFRFPTKFSLSLPK